jgi:hypothetical protein
MRRRQLLRDGLLAAVVCVAVVAWLRRSGAGGALLDPLSAAAGCVGMVAVEVTLLRVPDLTRRLWERPAVQAAAALGTLGVAALAASTGAAWLAGMLAWGLLAYLLLVAVVFVLGRNPLAGLVGSS